MSIGAELGLGELISQVRKEIIKAKKSEKRAMFTLTEVELELNVVSAKSGKGELKFVVVGAGGEVQKERISKIKLKFSPYSNVFFNIEKIPTIGSEIPLEESSMRLIKDTYEAHVFCENLIEFIEQHPDNIKKQIISELSEFIKTHANRD
jgi:hypothetical protein